MPTCCAGPNLALSLCSRKPLSTKVLPCSMKMRLGRQDDGWLHKVWRVWRCMTKNQAHARPAGKKPGRKRHHLEGADIVNDCSHRCWGALIIALKGVYSMKGFRDPCPVFSA